MAVDVPARRHGRFENERPAAGRVRPQARVDVDERGPRGNAEGGREQEGEPERRAQPQPHRGFEVLELLDDGVDAGDVGRLRVGLLEGFEELERLGRLVLREGYLRAEELRALAAVLVLGRRDQLVDRLDRGGGLAELELGRGGELEGFLADRRRRAARARGPLEARQRGGRVASLEKLAPRLERLGGGQFRHVLGLDAPGEAAVGVQILMGVRVEVGGILEPLHQEDQPAFGCRDEDRGRLLNLVLRGELLAVRGFEIHLDRHHRDQKGLEVDRVVEQPVHALAVAASLVLEFDEDELALVPGAAARLVPGDGPVRVAGTADDRRARGRGRGLRRQGGGDRREAGLRRGLIEGGSAFGSETDRGTRAFPPVCQPDRFSVRLPRPESGRQRAQVAQSVEQRTENPCVGGSIPSLGTIFWSHPSLLMILKVAKLGVKTLRQKSAEVDVKAIARGDYEAFLADLEDTMHEYDGTGIAAPQVFTPLRVFLYEVHPEKRKRKEPEVALTALFNAAYEGVGTEREEDSEGCLSVPFLWGGVVPRFQTIRVRAVDRVGQPVSFEATGYHARVLQHEIDHLDGLVYLDRMPDMKSLAYTVNFG